MRTGGVPLAIVWSIGQMSLGHSVEAVLNRLGQPNNDIIRFCFEGVLQHITDKPAHNVMLALSLFAGDASREAMSHICNLPELDLDDSLVQLENYL